MKAKAVLRLRFNEVCLKRDRSMCVVCKLMERPLAKLDVHHITNRNELPAGGYVLENGISLCSGCHIEAEAGELTAEDLYAKINSSYELALAASNRLAKQLDTRS